jgi:hypothetical protein
MGAKIFQRQSRRFDPFKFILKTHKHNPPPFHPVLNVANL